MIDEKKITQAADLNADKYNPCRSTLDREEACRASFKDGVEWYMQVLWHDASEEPEENKEFIMYDGENWNEIASYVHEEPYSWMQLVGTFCFIKWCYVEDILPKGGEE